MVKKTTRTLGLEFLSEMEKIVGVTSGSTKYPDFKKDLMETAGSSSNMITLRAGAVFELAAGVYANGTTAERKRAAILAGTLQRNLMQRGVISYAAPLLATAEPLEAPGSSVLLKGLIALDLAGMYTDSNFKAAAKLEDDRANGRYPIHNTALRNSVYEEKAGVIVTNTGHGFALGLSRGENATFKDDLGSTLQMSSFSINLLFVKIASTLFYVSKYGEGTLKMAQKGQGSVNKVGGEITTRAKLLSQYDAIAKNIPTKFGNTFLYSTSKTPVIPTQIGQHPTGFLSLPIGGTKQFRGFMTSVGYNSLIAEFYGYGEMAKVAYNNKSSNFRVLREKAQNSAGFIEAGKILNYYSLMTQRVSDSALYDRCSPGYTMKNLKTEWDQRSYFNSMKDTSSLASTGFKDLSEKEASVATSLYIYNAMFIDPSHKVFKYLSDNLSHHSTSGKTIVEVFSEQGSGAALARAISGIGGALQMGQQQILL